MSKTRPPNRNKSQKRNAKPQLPAKVPKLSSLVSTESLNKLVAIVHDFYFSLKESRENAVTSPRRKTIEPWYVHVTRILANRLTIILSLLVMIAKFF